ncbi:MAG: ligand-binding sensor domain-containing protein, partial [bacterium]
MNFKFIGSDLIGLFFRVKVFVFLFLSSMAYLQVCNSKNPDNQYFYMSGISREQGLSHSQVKTIFKDSRGFFWFGTYDGLNRYDGYNCLNYLQNKGEYPFFQNKIIHSIYEDTDGALWIGASGGEVFRYDNRNETFSNFPMHIPVSSDDSSSNHINKIIADYSNKLWFATSKGLYQLCTKTDKIIPYPLKGMPESTEIETIAFESSGKMWLGTKGHGLFVMKDKKARQVLNGRINPFITGIIADNNKLWIATAGGGLYVYYPESGNYKQFLVKGFSEHALPNLINEIIPHNKGLYLATYGGIFMFDITKEVFHGLTSHNNFPSYPKNQAFNALYLDSQNILWAATQSMGVYKYYLYHDAFNHIVPFPEQKEHSGNIIHSVIGMGKNQFLIGSEAGLIMHHREKNTFKKITPKSTGNENFMVTKILPFAEDSLLIGTWGDGLWVFHSDKQILTKPKAFREDNKYS